MPFALVLGIPGDYGVELLVDLRVGALRPEVIQHCPRLDDSVVVDVDEVQSLKVGEQQTVLTLPVQLSKTFFAGILVRNFLVELSLVSSDVVTLYFSADFRIKYFDCFLD